MQSEMRLNENGSEMKGNVNEKQRKENRVPWYPNAKEDVNFFEFDAVLPLQDL